VNHRPATSCSRRRMMIGRTSPRRRRERRHRSSPSSYYIRPTGRKTSFERPLRTIGGASPALVVFWPRLLCGRHIIYEPRQTPDSVDFRAGVVGHWFHNRQKYCTPCKQTIGRGRSHDAVRRRRRRSSSGVPPRSASAGDIYDSSPANCTPCKP
jgi:hypothetical protein